jgi:hypothetical protein
MFKVGDKVYHIKYGWGIIEEKQDEDILSTFEEYTVWNNSNNNLLSFTEYTFQNFSQERPNELPETGELCLVRNGDDEGWIALVFKEYLPSEEYPYKSDRFGYKQLKRIKILD